MSNPVQITFPVGRLVAGSLVKGQTTDAENKPLVIKSGPNAGQPRVDFYFGVAIPKAGETHWNQTVWGRAIYDRAVADFPQGQYNSPTFAWKVTDGDSVVPNRAGKKPCDREGYKGHWVVAFSSGFAPKTFNSNGSAPVDPDSIKLGHYIQVAGSVGGNGSTQQPGVFINHSMVAHSGFGPEIHVGPDPTQAGFGTGPMPAAMSATPVGSLPGSAPPVPGAPPAPGAAAPAPPIPVPAAPPVPVAAPWPPQGWAAHPTAPGYFYSGNEVLTEADLRARNVTTPVAPPVTAPPPPIPTVPEPAILAPPQRVMLTGQNYDAMRAKGWTDEQMIANGHMAA